MKNILFFVRHFTERGTEVAIYDYARYNEEILGNKSYIICFTQQKQSSVGFPSERISYAKFLSRFAIFELNDISDVTNIINIYDIHFFYTLTAGGNENGLYQFGNRNIWQNCKTIKHCVFDTTYPESDYYICIGDTLNKIFNTNVQVIPHIVSLPSSTDNLKQELNIPRDSIVYGRYGGYDEFNIRYVYQAIYNHLNMNSTSNVYFLFMNTRKFYEHPRIIYLDRNLDLDYKVKFINTCDAMIHAREMGETFGLSIAEFSVMNKPVITCRTGTGLEQLNILGDKAITYNSIEELLVIFNNISSIICSRSDWNAYTDYSPQKIMNLFDKMIFSFSVE